MRQLAEFVAVLACGLFTGQRLTSASLNILQEWNAAVEIAAAEFSPSYHRGTIMQVTLASVCLLSSVAAWLAGATFWWSLRSLAGFGHPLHAQRHPADK